MTLKGQLEAYVPFNEQEARDLSLMLELLKAGETSFTRENKTAHFTASAWVVNPARDRVLLIWHNIYRSWAWMGGHADGDTDLASVARREAQEESGIGTLVQIGRAPVSIEILSVDGHEKRGEYVSTHLHYNVTYLFEADEGQSLRAKPDENSGVKWFALDDALAAATEKWMVERIYRKLLKRLKCQE